MVGSKKKKKLVIDKHFLIPKHTVCSKKETDKVYEKYNASSNNMPRIKVDDPALNNLEVKKGDLIKIEREDSIAGKVVFYRVVSNE